MGTASSVPRTLGYDLNHIPTTATAVQKLRRLAKDRRKSSRESLAVALDVVARERGYTNWKHVTVCEAETSAAGPAPLTLPESVREFLAEQQQVQQNEFAANPRALAESVFFAMDISDAEKARPDSYPDISECEDARAFLAGDIWTAYLESERSEDRNVEPLDDEKALQYFLDRIADYSFFKYSGEPMPQSLEDAFGSVFKRFLFPPTHVWLAGKFFDLANVTEVRSGVNGPVVLTATSASDGHPAIRMYSPSAETRADKPAPSAAASDKPKPLLARLDVDRLDTALYEYTISYSHRKLFSDAGFSSISDALGAAAEDAPENFIGFEVAYAGLVVGTYPVQEVQANAEAIARRAVENASTFRNT